jgi:N-acetylneuraminic acid mutarotase
MIACPGRLASAAALVLVLMSPAVPVVAAPASKPATDAETEIGWRSRPPLHTARIGAAYATVDGLIVNAGGFDPDYPLTIGSVEVRRTAGRGAWHDVAPMPTPRANAAAAVLGGRMWVAGGYADPEPGDSLGTSAVVELYNPYSDTWSVAPALPGPRAEAGAATLHGVLYVVGGSLPSGGGNEVPTGSAIAFDPRKRLWTPIAPLPVARARVRVVAVGDYLYAIGGLTAAGDTVALVDRYDPRTDTWRSMSPMKEDRLFPGVTVVGHGRHSRVVVIGGCQFVDGRTRLLRRTTEVFDPAAGRWQLLQARLPTGRCSLAAATEADGTVLAIGGGIGVANPMATTAVDALRLRYSGTGR